MAVQQWSAEDYAREGRFVADLAGDVVALLATKPGERILDLGCGDGALTAKLVAAGASVVAVDSAPDMVRAAQAAGLDARLLSMEQMGFEAAFEAAFSNAALHWVRDQDAMLAGVARALKPGGRFVAEMGGHGNVAALRVALRAALEHINADALLAAEHRENYFPTPEEYRGRLEAHGFEVASMALRPRPTPLGPGGVRGWYQTFRTGALAPLSPSERQAVLDHAERLLVPVLRDARGNWIADYVRLRFIAVRPH